MVLRHAFDTGTGSTTTVNDIVPPVRTGLWARDDFMNQLVSSFTVTATGTNGTTGVAGRPGIVTQTVTAVGDAARVNLATPSTTGLLVGGGIIDVNASVQVVQLSDGTDNLVVRVGLGDTAGATDIIDGCYLEYDFGTHGHHNWMLCTAANSARTKTTTGIAVNAGSYSRIHIRVNADASSVSCDVDGVAGASAVTTNIPTAASRTTTLQMQTVKALGALARQAFIDYYDLVQTFTTAR